MANDLSSIHRNVTFLKNKRKRKSFMEIVKEKILERKGDKQKTIAIEYRKNNDKQENLDNTYTIWQADNKEGQQYRFK